MESDEGSPRLSVIIPTVDRPTLLPRAVKSVINAKCDSLEIIIVDDGKTPPDLAIAALDCVHVVTNTGRKGAPSARNLGVQSARGSVILFLDDDDEVEQHYPQLVLDIADEMPEVVWGASAITVNFPDGTSKLETAKLSAGLQTENENFRRKIFAASAGFWVRRSTYLESGCFDPELWLEDDTDFCCRMLGLGHEPWYETTPGMVIYRDWIAGNQTGQLTRVTEPERSVGCYLINYNRHVSQLARYTGASHFLAHRLVRRATAYGIPVDFPDILRNLPGLTAKAKLVTYWLWRKFQKRNVLRDG